MRHTAPEEWLDRLSWIDDIPLRNSVAKIVWWDFFGIRPCTRRWDHLDHYLKTPSEDVEETILMLGLRAVGYSEERASMRVFPKTRLIKNKPENKPENTRI